MIRSFPKPLPMCEIQRLANRADQDEDLTAVWAGTPRGQAAPNGMAEIMRRSGQSSLGVSGGLTLIKNAAAFTAPSFRTTTSHRRQAGRVEHFAVVQQTSAADVTHESFYPMAGDHLRPGMSQRIGARTYNHYWRISAQVASLIREGEQEHLNDAYRAYELTYKLIADEINALSGQQFGPANTPAAATALAEAALSARLPRQLGTNPANWVRVLDRLLLQTQSRDRDGWHALDIGPPQTIGNKIIHPVTQRRTTRIGRVTSRQVVNY